MPTLRGHHLICLHFFNGKGYNEIFVKNLRGVLKKAEYEDIFVTDGADDICEKCPYLVDKRCQYDEKAEEEIQRMDERSRRLLNVKKGSLIKWKEIREKIPLIFLQWYKDYCCNCDWLKTCRKINTFKNSFKRVFVYLHTYSIISDESLSF